MDYAVEPDVPFLADALLGLAKLNVRHFRDDPELAKTVLRRMLARDYVWVNESPDTWQDVVQMANPKRKEFDCEDFAAALAALIVICFGEARVGIRRVDTHQCHALAGKGSSVYDVCPLFGMKGVSHGAGEWRTIKDKPMIAEVGSLFVAGVRRLMGDSEEKSPTDGEEKLSLEDQLKGLETGASISNVLRSLLPPVAIDRLEQLERDLATRTKERDAFKKERDTLVKERDALKKGLTDMTLSRNDQSAKRINAETAVQKAQSEAQNNARLLAEARAFHTACKQQLETVIARSNDENAKKLAQEGLDRLEKEKPEDYMEAFADDDQSASAWQMLATGAAHIESLPDCDACGRGEPCTRTSGAGASDEANGDEPPENTSGPDSDEFTSGYAGPPSSDRPMSLEGCTGSCRR